MNEKKLKMPASVHIRRVIAYVVLIILSFLCLFWFYVLFINASRSNGELGKGFTAIPSKYLLRNLNKILFHGTQDPLRGMLNSFIIAAGASILGTYFSTMTAFAIHAYKFRFRKAMLTFILAVMMIPTQVSALGFIKWMAKLKMMNSYAPLIIPSIAAPITFFFMKQYMDSVLSPSLLDAARIDGAGEFRIFNAIVLPLMKPAIAVQMVFTFVSSWNNYFIPALILKEKTMKTLPIMLAELRNADFMKFDMGQVYAMIAFSIFPVIIVYLILSRQIVSGVTLGGVKE
jgi:multiple sugar transport system permease protein